MLSAARARPSRAARPHSITRAPGSLPGRRAAAPLVVGQPGSPHAGRPAAGPTGTRPSPRNIVAIAGRRVRSASAPANGIPYGLATDPPDSRPSAPLMINICGVLTSLLSSSPQTGRHDIGGLLRFAARRPRRAHRRTWSWWTTGRPDGTADLVAARMTPRWAVRERGYARRINRECARRPRRTRSSSSTRMPAWRRARCRRG